MTTTEAKNMSTAERLRAMECLWDALCGDEDNVDSPEWHRPILEDRRKLIESGDAEFISMDELKKAVRR